MPWNRKTSRRDRKRRRARRTLGDRLLKSGFTYRIRRRWKFLKIENLPFVVLDDTQIKTAPRVYDLTTVVIGKLEDLQQ